MTTVGPDALLSPSDVADIAGVKRPVVSNWRKRYADFPAAVAGTEAKPLFARDAVVSWLRERGYRIEQGGAGVRLWAALNAIRDQVPMDDAADFVLLLATLKRADQREFQTVLEAPSDRRAPLLIDAVRRLRQLPGMRDLREPSPVILQLHHSASLIAHAVSQTDDARLAEAADFVLERTSRWQIKGGAESGFIGSRTSALLASLVGQSGGTIYDPACGIANVLIRISEQRTAGRLVGSDINHDALNVAAQRAFLHNAAIEFFAGDVLAHDLVHDLRADVVVVEPPFGIGRDPSPMLVDARIAFGVPPRSSADLAWVQLAIAYLAPGGRAYVLTPRGALFRGGAERQIRANLLSAGCIEAVVELPTKLLPQTSIGLALWVLRPRAEASDVLLVDASGVDDIEDKVAAWLDRAGPQPIDAPQASVPITDLLAADAALTPSKWVGSAAVDTDAIRRSIADSSAVVANTIRIISDTAPTLARLEDLPAPRLTTVRELMDNGILDLRLGRPDKARELDEATEPRIVRASDVKHRRLPSIDGLPAFEHRDLTAEGDVLVTTMNEVRAVVDGTGGHLPSTGVDRLRVIDKSVLNPHYLAEVITGSWNARLQTGSTIQRAPIRDLEIPLIPTSDQGDVVVALQEVTAVQALAEHLSSRTGELRGSILEAIRYDVPLSPPDLVGSRRQDDGNDDKDRA